MMRQYGSLAIVAIAFIAGVSDARQPKKIVGGERAEVGEFPYQVLMKYGALPICGGAIISSRHVLTAKHCVDFIQYPYTNLKVFTGSIEIGGGQAHRVKEIDFYDYRKPYDNYISHDIAIIELNETIALNNSTQKIVQLGIRYLDVSSTANVTGWGRLNETVHVSSRYLMKLGVTVERLNMPYGNIIYARGAPETGTCFGDSGSPLVRYGRLVGITSTLRVGCAMGFPDNYMNVAYYKDWIRSVMERE